MYIHPRGFFTEETPRRGEEKPRMARMNTNEEVGLVIRVHSWRFFLSVWASGR
jgi:hypothetical protein